ncbi:MAG: glycosyltransferase [Thiobacillus sp.]|nr:glycosyltransferase [Thiobacillus sp.]
MPAAPATPLVSVLMPAYNHAPYVRAAVESVLGQTYDNLELIVIDDASSDATWAVLQSFDDARMRLYRHDANQGAHATLNEALALAKGAIIAIINSDDLYYPERLQRAVSCLTDKPGLGACFSHYDYIDETGSVVQDSESLARKFPDAARDLGPAAKALDLHELQVLSLLARNYLHTTSNLVCRREVFEHVGQFRGFRYVHDHEFFLRLCQRYPIEVAHESLLGYRFHATNTLAESAVASVAETAAMLAEFFLTQELKPMRQGHPAFLEVLGYLLRNLRAYGADRLVLLLVLAQRDWPRQSDTPLFLRWALDDSIRHQVGTLRDNDRAADDLHWQKTQTTRWWDETRKCHAKRSRVINKLWETRRSLRWSEQQLAWWRDKYQRTLTARIRRALRGLLDMANKVTRNTNQ